MEELEERIARLKSEFNRLRPSGTVELPPDLQRAYDIELTYASNAIEGNTLSLAETADLIEHGITVGGKTIREHLEAVDHFEAVQWVRTVAARREPLSEATITELHRRIVARSRPEIAGFYSQHARRVLGSPMVFPNPAKIPKLMEELGAELSHADDQPRTAFEIHYKLVTIHPFDDGNGRTARLLMNLILIRSWYVPVSVRPEDRQEYRETLKIAQLAQDHTAPEFQGFMHRRLAETLEQYVRDLREGLGNGAGEERGASVSPDHQNTPTASEREELSADEIALFRNRGGLGR